MPRTISLLNRFFVLIFFGYVFWMFYVPVETGDIFWHLATGRWIFENGQFPAFDVFSPRISPSEWILTQAGGSCLLYSLFTVGGLPGLMLFRSVLFCGVFALILAKARERVPFSWTVAFLAVIALDIFLMRLHLRPYIFNFIFIQLYLMLLSEHKTAKSKLDIFLIPFLTVIWFNLHVGAAVYGTILIGIFCLVSIMEYVQKISDDKPHIYLTVLAGHFLAFFANPFGVKGAMWPFRAFFDQNFVVQKLIMNTIGELNPPMFLFSIDSWRYWILFLCTLIALLRSGRNRFRNTLLVSIATGLFIYGARASGFWAIICLYTIIDAFADNDFYAHYARTTGVRSRKFIIVVITTLYMLFSGHQLYNVKAYVNGQTLRVKEMRTDPYNPHWSVNFLKRFNITGTVFNWDAYGGYMIFDSYPALKPFTDGRQADPELYELYIRTLQHPQRFWEPVSQKYNISIAMLNGGNHTQHRLMDYLFAHPRWQMIYVNGNTVTFLKAGVYPLPRRIIHYDFATKRKTVTRDMLKKIDPSTATGKDPKYSDLLSEGLIFFSSGYPAEGLIRLRENFEQIRSPEAAKQLNQAVDIYTYETGR